MPEIRPEPEDVIQEKLSRIKCVMNCQNHANYLIFGHGLYCSSCLSEVKGTTAEEIINFEALADILVRLCQEYSKSTKGELSHYKVLLTETDKSKQTIKKLRDSLNFETKSTRAKSADILDDLYKKCLKEFTLEEMEALYEPSMTATSIINEKQLLLANLAIMEVDLKGSGSEKTVQYQFKNKNKDPVKVFKGCDKGYKQVRNCLQSAHEQTKGILENFRKDIAVIEAKNKSSEAKTK